MNTKPGITSFLVVFMLFFYKLAEAETAVVTLLDRSSSLTQTDARGIQTIAAQLLISDIELTDSNVNCGLVFFSDSAVVKKNLTSCVEVRSALSRVDLMAAPDGHTNMKEGLQSALTLLRQSSAQRKIILLLTDGAPDLKGPDDDHEKLKQEILEGVINTAQTESVSIYSLGFSQGVDMAFMQEMSNKTGGKAVVAQEPKELISTAKKLFQNYNIYPLKVKDLGEGSNNAQKFDFKIEKGIQIAKIVLVLESSVSGVSGINSDDVAANIVGPEEQDLDESMYSIRPGYQEGSLAVLYSFLTNPSPGKYTISIKPSPDGELVGVSLGKVKAYVDFKADFDIKLNISPDLKKYAAGEKISVIAGLTSTSNEKLMEAHFSGNAVTSDGSVIGLSFSGTQASLTIPSGTKTLKFQVKGSVKGIPQKFSTQRTIRVVEPEKVVLHTNAPVEGIDFIDISPEEGASLSKSFTVSYTQDNPELKNRKPVRVNFSWDFAPRKIEEGGNSFPLDSWFVLKNKKGGRKIKIDGKKVVRIKENKLKKTTQIDLVLEFRVPKFDSPESLQNLKGTYKGYIKIDGGNIQEPLRIPVKLVLTVPTIQFEGSLLDDSTSESDKFPLTDFFWDGYNERAMQLPSIRLDSKGTGKYRFVAFNMIANEDGKQVAKILSVNGVKGAKISSGETAYGPFNIDDSRQSIEIVTQPIEENLNNIRLSDIGLMNYTIESSYGDVRSRQLIKVYRNPTDGSWFERLYEFVTAPNERSFQGRNLAIIFLSTLILIWLVFAFRKKMFSTIKYSRYSIGSKQRYEGKGSIELPTSKSGLQSIATIRFLEMDNSWRLRALANNLFVGKKNDQLQNRQEVPLTRGAAFGIADSKGNVVWRFVVSQVLKKKVTIKIKKSPIPKMSDLLQSAFRVSLLVLVGWLVISNIAPILYSIPV